MKHSSQNSIIFLQETHSTEQVENNWRKMWRWNFFFSHGDNGSRGVLIGVKDGLEFKINKEIKNQNGRILILDVDIQEEPYVLINYYANNDQAGQVKTLTELCDLFEKIEFKENTKVIWRGEILICFSIQPCMQTIVHL